MFISRRRAHDKAGRTTVGWSACMLATDTITLAILGPFAESSALGTAPSARSSSESTPPAAAACACDASSDIISTPM
eukprot:scaffold104802_cov31-Tisochrysis_lutea.AAC.7